MLSSGNLNSIIKDIMARLNTNVPYNTGNDNPDNGSAQNNNSNNKSGTSGNKISITPSQALVIGGILGGVLGVDSVLVDKDQTVQIVLSGSLRQKTELEKMLDQIGSKSFDEVMKAMLGRL